MAPKSTTAPAKSAGTAQVVPATVVTPEGEKPANISPADSFSPSGAPNQTVPDLDLSHPAIDANPRAGTVEAQNRIDMNDPHLSGAAAVAKNLKGE
ncbi:hypothetical protein ACO2RV_04585 [Ancylobacter sp. VNQ12]|uniref:hypothetical protein n=1 Tax=Ancylobacter sp. VNQ12 TaxID=3400920 RepID=UPI003C0B9B8F